MMNKRARTSIDRAVVDLWKREVGELSTRNFTHRLGASEDLVLRLDIYRKLKQHRGCVNTVRHAQILESGQVETSLLGKHQGRAHKLAIEPGSPHIFYTCGEDGLVQHFDLRSGTGTELFTCVPIDDRRNYMPVIRLNAIAIDPRNPNLFAVAGSDEYTRVYDIRKYKWDGSSDFGQPANYFCPPHLIGDEQVGITGLAFSEQSELLVSYNDEFIYLFTRDMGLGANPVPSSPMSIGSDASEIGGDYHSAGSSSAMDADEKVAPQAYKGHRNCETVKGRREGSLLGVMEADKDVVNCIESHPHTMVLASSGIDNDIKMWALKALRERSDLGDMDRAMVSLVQTIWAAEELISLLLFGKVLADRTHWFAFGDDDGDSDYFYDDVIFYDDNDEDEYDDEYEENDDDDEEEEEDEDDSRDNNDVLLKVNNDANDYDFYTCVQQKPKARGWMYHLSSPQDLMRLFSLQRRRRSPEHGGDNSATGREILELILTYNANSDASSDDGGDTTSQDDLFC
ncbi:hypothetical protein FNV43_RR21855 [Rhamnella rubrinervis]|uniref:Uncharacterized protein n=1 Tax=Rhamnella rubrinervis TaxID=2594499 RepID=A0A8K0GQI4_9ROSA|nr:hypothetical protein FNV43_RR21855 [Rhamnella rubrinervis]